MPDRTASSSNRAGFTLVELVVVLAILALVTTLAFRSVDQIEDQRRYEAGREMLGALEKAVLGDEETAGFTADMGRLPRTRLAGGELTLAELWLRDTLPAYDVRSHAIDSEVRLPSGWRGPYLSLPMDAANVLDGWGNPMRSLPEATPANPTTTGYHRLRDADDAAIVAAGQPVSIIRHLGANGERDAGDTGLERDLSVAFATVTPAVNRYAASVKTVVEFLDSDGSPGSANAGEKVTVRVFSPDPADASVLAAFSATTDVAAASATVSVPEPTAAPAAIEGSTLGQRAVRAYLYQNDGVTLMAKSTIKYITLRPGVNFIPLTIYR